jgi:hypothetical protein
MEERIAIEGNQNLVILKNVFYPNVGAKSFKSERILGFFEHLGNMKEVHCESILTEQF